MAVETFVGSSIVDPKSGVVVFGANGGKGWEYTQAMAEIGDVKFVAFVVNNTVRDELKALATKLDVPILKYDSEEYKNFFSKHSFQSAVVATPHHMNHEITSMLIKQGIFVIQEKPLALTPQIALDLRQTTVERAGFPIFTTVQRGTMPIFEFAKSKLAEIGSVTSSKYVYNLSVGGPVTGWRADRASGGCGIIQDAGYHPIDMVHEFFGKPMSAKADIAFKYPAAEEKKLESYAKIDLSYSGFDVTICLDTHASKKEEFFFINGENGSLKIFPTLGKVEIYDRAGVLSETAAFPFKKEQVCADMLNFALQPLTSEHQEELEKRFLRHIETTKTIEEIFGNSRVLPKEEIYGS